MHRSSRHPARPSALPCTPACLTAAAALACTAAWAGAARANVVVFEKFNETGTLWTSSVFSDVAVRPGGAFERTTTAAGLGAPSTTPALPINEGGDKEGRYFETGIAAAGSHALTADLPENDLADASIDGYIAFGIIAPNQTVEGGLVLRATSTLGPAGFSLLNGYSATIVDFGNNTAQLLLARVRDNIIAAGPDVLATSIAFPTNAGAENFHLHFSVNGSTLTARLARVVVTGGAVVERPVDLLADAGVQDTLTGTSSELISGRAGVKAFARSGNSTFFDDVDIIEHACDHMVNMESQAVGTQYGTPAGDAPGDLVFTEDSIPVRVLNFEDAAGNTYFGSAEIVPTIEQIGFGRIMQVNNINLGFNFVPIGRAARVTIEFGDQGGFENLRVNDAAINVGELDIMPMNIAPGVTLSVATTTITGGKRGVVTLEGDIGRVQIGGQEFWIDDICSTSFCACDWNHDFSLNSQDFFDFLLDFFAGSADFNADGATNSQDFFDWLNCFFTGCP